jgi:hypothetical protein
MIQGLSVLQQAGSQGSTVNVETVIVGALISAVFGVLTGWIGAYLKVRAENFATKQEFRDAVRRLEENTRAVGEVNAAIARRTSLDSELRDAVRQFTAAAGSMIHSMCWLTWDSVERKRVNAALVKSYDDEIHKQSPSMLSQLAVIAMLDRDAHSKLSPFADQIFALDVRVSEAIVGEEGTPGSQRAKLRTCHVEGYELEQRFRRGVAELFISGRGEPAEVDAVAEA